MADLAAPHISHFTGVARRFTLNELQRSTLSRWVFEIFYTASMSAISWGRFRRLIAHVISESSLTATAGGQPPKVPHPRLAIEPELPKLLISWAGAMKWMSKSLPCGCCRPTT